MTPAGPEAPANRHRRPLHVLEVGLVWPAETFLRLKAEGLAARGFRVTAAAVVPPGNGRPRLKGVETIRQPYWGESPARMLAGVLGQALELAVRNPRSLLRVLAAARAADVPAEPGHHPRTVASLPDQAGAGRGRARRLTAIATRLRFYLPLARVSPDVVHFEWNSAAISYLPLVGVWSCPTVVSCHGSEVNVRPHLSNGRGFALRLRASFQEVGAVHCVSKAIAAEAAKHGMDPTRAWLIRPGVDSQFFRPTARAETAHTELRVLSVGVLRWLKGHEYALRAISRLVEWGIPVRLDVLGEDAPRALGEPSDRARIEHAIDQLGLGDRVHLRGLVAPSEVRRRLHGADVLLHASLSEGIPTAVLEAMACRVPVVVTECGGVREAITDGVEGFLVPPRTPAKAAVALRALYADPGLRTRMGAAGRARVESQFSLTRQVDEFAAGYEALAAGRTADFACPDISAEPAARIAPAHDAFKPLRLLSIAPLSWTQSLEDAIHAVRLLRDRGFDVRYRIVGDGEYEDALRFARYELGLGREVEFLGPRPSWQWPEQMRWANVFLDVSVRDSPRDALVEACAAGLQTLTTATALADGDGRICAVPRRDPDAVARALASVTQPSAEGRTTTLRSARPHRRGH